ncbi:MAG: SMC-Scp complex subunit ScpB [Chloroflexi bacterium]|nr:MAG: SMC-Scp complex subunit ScpB [Chloroflexota bacterium]
MTERAQSALQFEVAASDDAQISAALEALLFVSPDGETVQRLATALEVAPATIREGLRCLEAALRSSRRGLRVQQSGERYQLVSAAEYGPAVARLLGLERSIRLSAAALETLALIAYRQPVTRGEIEAVRGVDSASVIATLLARELIAPIGKRMTPGSPTEYGTTAQFLQAFGLTTLEELPTLGDLEISAATAERARDGIDQ